MNQEKEIPGTPERLVDALLEPLSDELAHLRKRLLTEDYTILPKEVNALNNLQGVLLALSQSPLAEVRRGLANRILQEAQRLLLLAGSMVSLQELKESRALASSSNPLATMNSDYCVVEKDSTAFVPHSYGKQGPTAG